MRTWLLKAKIKTVSKKSLSLLLIITKICILLPHDLFLSLTCLLSVQFVTFQSSSSSPPQSSLPRPTFSAPLLNLVSLAHPIPSHPISICIIHTISSTVHFVILNLKLFFCNGFSRENLIIKLGFCFSERFPPVLFSIPFVVVLVGLSSGKIK